MAICKYSNIMYAKIMCLEKWPFNRQKGLESLF